MKSIFQQALELMDQGVDFAYVAVTGTIGSTPRKNGSRMLVLPDKIVGTVGGGKSEYLAMQAARQQVLPTGVPQLVDFDLTRKADMDSGFICGGKLRTLIFKVSHDDVQLREVMQLCADALEDGADLTVYHAFDQRDPQHRRCFTRAESSDGRAGGCDLAECEVSRQQLDALKPGAMPDDQQLDVRCYAELVFGAPTLYLLGCGHVSREVALLAVHLGFRVIAMDDRPEFANPQNMPGCQTLVLDDYEHIPSFDMDSRAHVLVITSNHVADRLSLRWALGTRAPYIGMIGSKSKKKTLYERLVSDGDATPQQLAEVFCPVGLSLGAQTPAGIAVSIMAQIIAFDNGELEKLA